MVDVPRAGSATLGGYAAGWRAPPRALPTKRINPAPGPATFGVVPGRRLNAVELEHYTLIPRALAERVRVYEIPSLPGSYVGITLGRHVFLATDVADDGQSLLLAHELVHTRQWHEQGVVGFGRRYVGAFVRSVLRTHSWNESYRAIPAEVEAREDADRWQAILRRL